MLSFTSVIVLVILLLVCSSSSCNAWLLPSGARSRSHATALSMSASKYLTKNKPVFVAGGSSGVGLELVKKLSAMGTPVHALVRREEAVQQLQQYPHVKAILGDAFDEAAVQKCMEGCVAAVTTLGGQPAGGQGERVDYVGNSNVVEQAGILGVERIILVTRYYNFCFISYMCSTFS